MLFFYFVAKLLLTTIVENQSLLSSLFNATPTVTYIYYICSNLLIFVL
jgi:hypothetical protein